MIDVERLAKAYHSRGELKVAVNGISFSVEEGEFFTLLGPSGCGKTTTLRCIAGLEQPTSGVLRLDGMPVYENRELIPTHKRDIGMVFQSYAVWPHLSVFANAAFPLRVKRSRPSRSEIERRVNEALALVGLEHLGKRPATNLSGGQQQRLALARALVREPKVLLLDEPLSNLDARLRERMREEIRILQQRLGVTTILVTHDQVEALSMSDRIAVMRDGEVAQIGTPTEIYTTPSSLFVCNFVGGTNMLQGTVSALGQDTQSIVVECAGGRFEGVPAEKGLKVGDRVVAAIRHEHMSLAPRTDTSGGLNRLHGTVEATMFEGPSRDLSVRVGDDLLRVRTTADGTGDTPGAAVELNLPARFLRVFAWDEAGVSVADSVEAVDPEIDEAAASLDSAGVVRA